MEYDSSRAEVSEYLLQDYGLTGWTYTIRIRLSGGSPYVLELSNRHLLNRTRRILLKYTLFFLETVNSLAPV